MCVTKNTPLHGQISPKTYLVYLICFVFVFCLGGTGRFDSASGAVKNLGYTVITNEATGYYEQYEGLQFNVCVPPPKTTNPVLGPPKKSVKVPKTSF